MNVTAVDPTDVGYLTAFPCGAGQPNASNLNYYDGTDIANTVVTRTGSSSGRACIYTFAATHLLADINGYVPSGASIGTLVPARLLETRAPNAELTPNP